MPGIVRKWRPSLGQVIGGALLGTLGMSFVGLVVLRIVGPVIGYRWGVALVGAAILLATLMLLWLLMRLLLRPIKDLADRAGTLRRDPMARAGPLPHYGTRELGDLGDSVLAMASRLQAREATIRSFTDHVTHEMKTPLSPCARRRNCWKIKGLTIPLASWSRRWPGQRRRWSGSCRPCDRRQQRESRDTTGCVTWLTFCQI